MAFRVALPAFRPFSRRAFLEAGAQKVQVSFQDVLNAEENIAETRLAHQWHKGLTVVCDG